jgi:hypothetical protein
MRTSNWSAIIGGIGLRLLAGLAWTGLATGLVAAQQPAGRYMPATYEASLPSGGYPAAGGFAPAGGYAAPPSGYLPASYQEVCELPGAGALGADGYGAFGGGSPGTAWPTPSVYGPRFAQSRNDGGLWQYEDDNSASRRYLDIDFLWMSTPRPENRAIGFPIRNPPTNQTVFLNGIDHSLGMTGARAFVGLENPDETGFQLGGFWLNQGTNGLYFPARNNGSTPILVQRIDPSTGLITTPLQFNRFLAADVTAQAWGAQGDFFTTPFLGGDGNMLRADYGVRYFGLAQAFDLSAEDTRTGRTGLHSGVSNQMVGPQGGVRWDIGGHALKISSTALAGALFNYEKTSLSTFNYDGRSMSVEESHRKISPMLEFAFTAEMPLFSYLPLINRIPVLSDGVFRIGYSWTGIFLVSRPTESYTWTSPLPVLDYSANKIFQLQGAHFGVEWTW